MQSFWWFQENSIAGFGRPGFNGVSWFEMSFEEAAVIGWIGQHSSGRISLAEFDHHLKTYVPRILPFYRLDAEKAAPYLAIFQTTDGLQNVLEKLNKRVRIFESVSVDETHLELQYCEENLLNEIRYLKNKGLNRIVSLTERHHAKEILDEHFETHHLAIQDLAAPKVAQAHELAEILKQARSQNEKVGVHCLAGIGRTSTMILAAHLLRGHELSQLQEQIQKQNPRYSLTGSQKDFLIEIQKISQNR